ncbi:hypothetical protein [Pseudoalteromonas sp. S554]|jgi:hypothetical protein|uniref:hypothetical protein n=1 Tax=Pseudoalteromonas sp. S554 TaxID=2066516 RepID=UPI000AC65B3D|nr:hypothetical protein [Pseudoalteromonas sp. S554]MDG1752602.1 hypothetical protein [Thalassotalea sp.]|tara:strand:- start:223 stop:561 length:339 start_codon:yes stop_codon:yes gene_type:complete
MCTNKIYSIKRLSKKLSISLGQSQEMLSYVVYGCDSYGQLMSLVKSDLLENLNLILAILHSKAEGCLLKFLNTDMNNILSRFNERVKNIKINENTVVEIFGIELTDFKRKTK